MNSVKKEEIEFTHTVVPASMRSAFWKYFGFPADGANNILTRQKVICKVCGKAIVYSKNTSNLQTHLASKHEELMNEIREQRMSFEIKDMNTVDKEEIEFTHTVVPASMRSAFWKYFGFPADGANNILTRQKVICTVCGKAIVYSKNTSNLRTHLVSKHEELMLEIREQRISCEPPRSSASNDDFEDYNEDEDKLVFKRSYENESFGENEGTSATKMRRELTPEFITIGCLSAGGSDQPIEQAALPIIGHVNNGISVPIHDTDAGTYEYFETDVAGVSCDGVEAQSASDCKRSSDQQNDVCGADGISRRPILTFSVDMSPSFQSNDLVDLMADMLINDLVPVNIMHGNGFKQLLHLNKDVCQNLVEAKILDEYSKMQRKVRENLDATILQWNKPFSLSMEFYDNIEGKELCNVYVNYINLDRNNELFSILYEIVDENVTEAIELGNTLKSLDMRRCAAIVTTEPTKPIINKFAQIYNIPIIECLNTMLTRCLQHIFALNIVDKTFKEFCKSRQQLEVGLPKLYLPCPWSKLNFLKGDLTNESVGEDTSYQGISEEFRLFLEYIDPLKIILETIFSEPLPLSSLARPLIISLLAEKFSARPTKSNHYLELSQTIVTTELSLSINKNPFWSEATLFDARFQHEYIQQLQAMPLIDIAVSNREHLEKTIYERFHQLIEHKNIKLQKVEKGTEQHSDAKNGTAAKSTLRMFFQRISDCKKATTPPPSLKSDIEWEFNRYRLEPTVNLEQCPIAWWQQHAPHYQQLHKIAEYYLCVPCCVQLWPNVDAKAPNERAALRQKRYALRHHDHIEKCLWYLHYNRKVFNKD